MNNCLMLIFSCCIYRWYILIVFECIYEWKYSIVMITNTFNGHLLKKQWHTWDINAYGLTRGVKQSACQIYDTLDWVLNRIHKTDLSLRSQSPEVVL